MAKQGRPTSERGRSGRRTHSGAAHGSRASERRGSGASRPGRPQGPRSGAPRGNYIEGRRAAAEALRCGFPVKRALIAKEAVAPGQGRGRDPEFDRIVAEVTRAGVPVREVPRSELDRLSSHGAHQGIVLEAKAFPYVSVEEVIASAGSGPALVVVLDHVTDEGNFGAIVRSAEVVGAAGVVIAGKRAASVGVGAYKTSAGAVMHIPIAQVPNIATALDQLKEAGFWVGGSSEHAEQDVWGSPLEGRIVLVMGSEGAGISRLVLEKCDFLVKLPQRGATESLNVAQAATVMCYEWLRANWPALGADEGAGA